VAVWGISFKAETDDIREAPSVRLIEALLAAGVKVRAYDPVAATPLGRTIQHSALSLTQTALQACENADVLVVMTDWDEFRAPNFNSLAAALKSHAIFDGRNLYDPSELRQFGLEHYGPWHKRAALSDNASLARADRAHRVPPPATMEAASTTPAP
jgi:UDPglucose 6-dehydrogenase